jgi:hypothetical protein
MQMRKRCWITMLIAAGMISGAACGQEKAPASLQDELAAYDLKRETTLIGTVQSFTPAAQVAPLGAHVTLETSGGLVDVHLGNTRLLAANKFIIQSGETLRIVGEIVSTGTGTQFVARIVQKGTQALAVRSVRGIPLSYMAPRDEARGKAQRGVL